MRVSVLICTWNRAPLLDRTLAELGRLRVPGGVDWEVLVVNNRCTDATDDVLARHMERLPLRRLYESQSGKSFAANLAVRESRGELLLWTDDDVFVDPLWLEAYVAAAAAHPSAIFFGGSVEPVYETEPPAWLRRNLDIFGGVLAQVDPRPDGQPVDRREPPPVGANMAMRRAAFDEARFNTLLGPCGNTRVCGEETELIHRLMDAGHQGVWVRGAAVRHHTPAERVTKKYMQFYWACMGRTYARLNFGEQFRLLAGAPRWAVRQYLTAQLTMRLCSATRGRRWALALCHAAKMKGLISEWRRLGAAAREATSEPLAA
jgi:glycosyltransferase involved in cell wall biosynthesis